jgi:glycosyltransferase involved in cell wall biosynthesis
MLPKRQLRVLLIAPYYDQTRPSESWSTYKWVSGVCARYETTVLTSHWREWQASASPVDAKEIVNWVDPKLPHALRRVDYMLRPQYPLFVARVRRWFSHRQRAGDEFDLIHQVSPTALRYPYPLLGCPVPYILGPLCGSLETPAGFRAESPDQHWYMRLRGLDQLRIHRDPWLRGSYQGASAVLGAAPYVEDLLSGIGVARFTVMSETGVDAVDTVPKQSPAQGEVLKLLFVGRVVRTKGVIDAIRALALAAQRSRVEFHVVGGGPMLETCKEEACRLRIAHLVHFHGRLPRDEVTQWYQRSHAFLFPSFREPSGNVVFEAMSHGLPVITATGGGPGHVVTDASGFRVEPTDPASYPVALARAISHLASDPADYQKRSEAALARVAEIATWPRKIAQLSQLYADVAGATK